MTFQQAHVLLQPYPIATVTKSAMLTQSSFFSFQTNDVNYTNVRHNDMCQVLFRHDKFCMCNLALVIPLPYTIITILKRTATFFYTYHTTTCLTQPLQHIRHGSCATHKGSNLDRGSHAHALQKNG